MWLRLFRALKVSVFGCSCSFRLPVFSAFFLQKQPHHMLSRDPFFPSFFPRVGRWRIEAFLVFFDILAILRTGGWPPVTASQRCVLGKDFMRHIYDNVIAMLAMYERFSVLDALKCLAPTGGQLAVGWSILINSVGHWLSPSWAIWSKYVKMWRRHGMTWMWLRNLWDSRCAPVKSKILRNSLSVGDAISQSLVAVENQCKSMFPVPVFRKS